MSSTDTFTLYIINIVKKARDKTGWVLRVFQLRERSLMLTLLKSLVIPLLEYMLPALESMKRKDIQAIEVIQRTSTYKITELQHALKLLGKTTSSNCSLSGDAVNVI